MEDRREYPYRCRVSKTQCQAGSSETSSQLYQTKSHARKQRFSLFHNISTNGIICR